MSVPWIGPPPVASEAHPGHGQDNASTMCFACAQESADFMSALCGRKMQPVRNAATEEYARWFTPI